MLAPPLAQQPAAPAPPETFTFSCSLCDTRITVRTADVGKRIACPDCGRKNVIPEPPAPRAPVVPAAMGGEQLEVWGVDELEFGEPARSAASPRFHPVECKLCQTLMYATDDQIGAKLQCPDCGSFTVATRAAPPKRRGLAAVPPGQEYQVDPALAPPLRPVPVPIAIRDAELHAAARATTVGPDGRLIVQKNPDLEVRPVRPAIPLVQGAWRMLATEEVLARWILISIAFGAAAWFVIDSLNTPVQSVAAIAGIFLMLLGVATSVVWMSLAAPFFLAIIAESSDGSDRLHDPPQWSPFDWFVEAGYLAIAGVLAGAPAFLAWRFGAAMPEMARWGIGVGAALVIFPMALLGALLESTPLGVISPRLLSSLGRCLGPWLLFYFETAMLAAAGAAGGWGLMQASPPAVFAVPLIAMGGAVIYMRLLGRLAWWLSDLMPETGEPEREFSRYRTEIAARHAAEDAPPPKFRG